MKKWQLYILRATLLIFAFMALLISHWSIVLIFSVILWRLHRGKLDTKGNFGKKRSNPLRGNVQGASRWDIQPRGSAARARENIRGGKRWF